MVRCHAVILNWHDPDRTRSCIESLLRIPSVFHIWVVDSESDGTLRGCLEDLSEFRVTILELSDNVGFASATNIGLRQAMSMADAVLCVNTDVAFDNVSIERLSSALIADDRIGMVGPRIHTDGQRPIAGSTVNPWTLGIADFEYNRDPDFLTWACVMVRTEALRDIGLLREDFFMYWEDVDFGLRMRASKWRLVVERSSLVKHERSVSHARAGAWIATYSAAGVVLMGRIHGGRFRMGSVVRIMGRLCYAVVRLDFARASAVLRGVTLGSQHRLGTAIYPEIIGLRCSHSARSRER